MCCGSLTICTRLWREVVMERDTDTRNPASGSFSNFSLSKGKRRTPPTTDHEMCIYVRGSRHIYLLRCGGQMFPCHRTPQAGRKAGCPTTGGFGGYVAQGRLFPSHGAVSLFQPTLCFGQQTPQALFGVCVAGRRPITPANGVRWRWRKTPATPQQVVSLTLIS